MPELTPNQERLLRFVTEHVPIGQWTHLGDDARPDALVLAEQELVEVNEAEDKYRLPVGEEKLVAFPYDENKFGGDHEFYVGDNQVPYNDGDTFTDLVAKVDAERFGEYVSALEKGEITQEDYDAEIGYAAKVLGFWLIRAKDMEVAEAVWPEDGCGNDSATYQCNRAAKRIVSKLAIREITPD